MQRFEMEHPSGAKMQLDWYDDKTPPSDDQAGSILADHAGMPDIGSENAQEDDRWNDQFGDDGNERDQAMMASYHRQNRKGVDVPYAPPLPEVPVNQLSKHYSLQPLPSHQLNSKPSVAQPQLKQQANPVGSPGSTQQDYPGMATDAAHGGYYRRVISNIAKKYGVDPAAIQAIINQENSGNPNCVNHNTNGTSDYGIMQVNSDTRDPGTYNWRDPERNIEAGVQEFAGYLRHYKGNYHTAFHRYNGFGAPASAYADPVYNDYMRIKGQDRTK